MLNTQDIESIAQRFNIHIHPDIASLFCKTTNNTYSLTLGRINRCLEISRIHIHGKLTIYERMELQAFCEFLVDDGSNYFITGNLYRPHECTAEYRPFMLCVCSSSCQLKRLSRNRFIGVFIPGAYAFPAGVAFAGGESDNIIHNNICICHSARYTSGL